MNIALMPCPRHLRATARRAIAPEPNIVRGSCSDRLLRAVRALPPMGLAFDFAIARAAKLVPALDDSYDYRLTIDESVHVEAEMEWGALAALATLAQLAVQGTLPTCEVRDAPRYPWRGVMIDTVRHFITLESLRRTLDGMWLCKLNVLHLHLTDDQGFRFRSQKYPELASPDTYTAAELGELVAYAADRGIRVVPELDVPGHTTSWLAAHPEWGAGETDAASRRFGVHRGCLNVADPHVVAVVAALLAELAAVFPDEFMHFGGDEVQAHPRPAQTAFHRQVVAALESLGKRAIGWDECLAADLPPRTVVQAWRGNTARDRALAAGFDCVASAPYYLDLFYPAEVHHAYDPAGDVAAAEKAMIENPRLAHVREGIEWMAGFADFPILPSRSRGRVLGGEACLWTELVTDELLDTRLWSRLPAIAECFWSGGGVSIEDLYERLTATRRALAQLGIVAEDSALADAYPDLMPLIEMLEPVKWYRRLLGDAGFARRVSGIGGSVAARPYDADTPLVRIVDRLEPESPASRRAEADLAAGVPMAQWLDGWRAQRTAMARYPELAGELLDASCALAELAAIVDGRSNVDAASLAGPFGEYLLPVAYAVAKRH